jgi:hypothetical protein
MPKSALVLAVAAALFCPAASRAGEWPDSCLPADDAPAKQKDGAIWSFQFLAGYYEMTSLGPDASWQWMKAKENYAPLAFRLGCECPHTFLPGCWLEGTWEGLLEYNVSPIVRDFGTYFTGPCGIIRYNYRREDSLVFPYLQGGAGFVLTDAYHNVWQRLIGEPFEFLLRFEAGIRFLITENFSLDVEGGLQHISNAGLAGRNGGINNLGISIGFTYEFGRR